MRTTNRLASLLLAATLLAGGSLLAAETALAALGRPALLIDRAAWYTVLTTTRLDAPWVRALATLLAVAGLGILVAQLRRWAPQRVRLPDAADWHLHRRSVEHRLARVACGVPGIRRATARVHGHAANWRPRIRAVGDPTAQAAVDSAVRRELARLAAPSTGRIDIDLTRGRGTV